MTLTLTKKKKNKEIMHANGFLRLRYASLP